MPVLDNILPTANGAALGSGEKNILPGAPAKSGESFQQVMTRALSSCESSPPAANGAALGAGEKNTPPGAPAKSNEPFHQVILQALSSSGSIPPAVPPRRASTKIISPQKKTFPDSILPAATATENPPAITKDCSAPVKVETGIKPEDNAAKDADLPAQNLAGIGPDASQNTPIFLFAPALTTCSLKSFSPAAAPKSAANSPVVVAMLSAGADVKSGAPLLAVVPGVDATVKTAVANSIPQLASGASQNVVASKSPVVWQTPVAVKHSDTGQKIAEKSDLKVAGASVAAPKIPELAEAGDPASEKNIAVPADDLPPKNSGGPVDLQNSTLEAAAIAAVKPHGTSVAKQDLPMKNTEQTNKVAGAGEQVLPGAVVSPARENNLPGRTAAIPVSGRVMLAETNAATVPIAQDNPVRLTLAVENAAAASNFSEVRGQVLERTHDLMALQATRLVSANSDSLQVVIKPDAGTQLSLELRQRGGGIEAQAVLQAGDFENLKQHWPELQQRLELRGIKLAPLTSDGGSASWSGNQGFKNQQPPPGERESFPPGIFAGFVPATGKNNLPEEPANQAAPSRGWQTWA